MRATRVTRLLPGDLVSWRNTQVVIALDPRPDSGTDRLITGGYRGEGVTLAINCGRTERLRLVTRV